MHRLGAECLGTFILVFAGTGAIVVNDLTHGAVTHPGIALTFGLVVFAMIQTFGWVSGAHFNPAISLAMVALGKLEPFWAPGYLLSQFIGAIGASILLKVLFPNHPTLGATLPAGSEMQSLVLEFFLGFILMISVIGCCNAPGSGNFLGPVIGGIIGLEALFAGPISGASMNPARSLAPALLSGHLESLWIYFVGPIFGTLVALPVARFIFKGTPRLKVIEGEGMP